MYAYKTNNPMITSTCKHLGKVIRLDEEQTSVLMTML